MVPWFLILVNRWVLRAGFGEGRWCAAYQMWNGRVNNAVEIFRMRKMVKKKNVGMAFRKLHGTDVELGALTWGHGCE